jgi:hypothetical protein
VTDEDKRKDNRKARQRGTGTYDPIRGPRLKGQAALEPAPEPAPEPSPARASAEIEEPALFGEAEEDGLRMLAALETMESLEPDFCDDLAGEAAVTIIERAAPFDVPPLDARAAIGAERHAAYHGPVDEAIVEIFEGPAVAPSLSGPRRKKGRPVAHRFFKALTGGDSD